MRLIKPLIFVYALCVTSISIHAQVISIPDTLKGWQTFWFAGLHGSQATYNNWSQGGVNTLSGTGSTVFTRLYHKGRYGYGFRINLKYGQAHIKNEGVRKTDDLIAIRNRLTYDFLDSKKLAAYMAVMLQTQFDKGYKYNEAPDGGNLLISKFFAPGYFTEGFGLSFKPSSNFTFEAGLGLKQTIVSDTALATNYGLKAGKRFKSEGGFTTGININKSVAKNIVFGSSFDTFTNLANNVKVTDFTWSNELKGKINKTVSTTFQFDLKYDDDYSKGIQLRQVLSVGVGLTIF